MTFNGLADATGMADPVLVRSRLEPGISGEWTLEAFEITQPSSEADQRPHWAQNAPGTYMRLRVRDVVMMTDTLEEWWTQKEGIAEACRRGGHILITGLGLAMVVDSMFQTPGSRVEKITVVEASEDVISLIAPQVLPRYPDRLEIVHGDAFTWQPPPDSRFTVAWHDIWPSPFTSSNEEEMQRIEAHYAGYCDWQGFWGRDMVQPH